MRFPRIFLSVALCACSLRLALGVEIPELTKRMDGFVAESVVANAVALVEKDGKVVHLSASGKSDIAAGRDTKTDDLYWIASMTKPMTAVCVLMLQDEGKLSVDDPVEKYLPEFHDQWLVSEETADRKVLIRPSRPVTLHDLLTHTGGIGNVDPPRETCSLAELCMAYAREPLQAQPGTKWAYSNASINILGRIVEVVSGTPYAEFMQQRLLTPLGMTDTTFWPTAAQVARIAKSYDRKDASSTDFKETTAFLLKGDLSDHARTAFPAWGLYSTAEDLAKFYRMMLNGGTYDGKTILSKKSVALMTSNQTGDLTAGFTPGVSWGLGFQYVNAPSAEAGNESLAIGSFGHGGAYGTQSWADPKTNTIYVLMIGRALGDTSYPRRAVQDIGAKSLK